MLSSMFDWGLNTPLSINGKTLKRKTHTIPSIMDIICVKTENLIQPKTNKQFPSQTRKNYKQKGTLK